MPRVSTRLSGSDSPESHTSSNGTSNGKNSVHQVTVTEVRQSITNIRNTNYADWNVPKIPVLYAEFVTKGRLPSHIEMLPAEDAVEQEEDEEGNVIVAAKPALPKRAKRMQVDGVDTQFAVKKWVTAIFKAFYEKYSDFFILYLNPCGQCVESGCDCCFADVRGSASACGRCQVLGRQCSNRQISASQVRREAVAALAGAASAAGPSQQAYAVALQRAHNRAA